MSGDGQAADMAHEHVTIPRPYILTGPAHQTVDEATIAYLHEAAERVRRHRYWGSGVSTLVALTLKDVAAAMEADDETCDLCEREPTRPGSAICTDCAEDIRDDHGADVGWGS